jgi:hypothetical protein
MEEEWSTNIFCGYHFTMEEALSALLTISEHLEFTASGMLGT